MKKEKGITLIALVVTIIVMIILAGVSIQLIFSDSGILQRAKKQKTEQIQAQILEELELAKSSIMIEGEGYTNLAKYLQAIDNRMLAGTYKVSNIEPIDSANAILWVDGMYKYTAAQVGIDVIINAEGYIGTIKPEIITFLIVGKQADSLSVELTARLADSYEFYIREQNNGDFKKVGERKTNEKKENTIETIYYQFENITPEEKFYELKVIAKNKVGQNEKTTTMIEAPVITVIDASTWTHDGKTVTIQQNPDYIIKYTIDESIPNLTNGIVYAGEFTVDTNCTVQAIYIDNKNQMGNVGVASITTIDTEGPTADIILSGDRAQRTLPITLNATVTHQDSASGIDITSCKYVLNHKSDEIGLEDSSYTGGTFADNENPIEIIADEVASWYLHVLSVDNVGNRTETIKGPIVVSYDTHKHVDPSGTVQGASYQSSSSGGCFTKENVTYTTKYRRCGGTYRAVGTPGQGTSTASCQSCGRTYTFSGTQLPGTIMETNCGVQIPYQEVSGRYYSLSCGKTEESQDGYKVDFE